MFDGRFRHGVNRGTSPVGVVLVRLGVRANALTVSGLVLAAVAATVIGTGHFAWGIVAMTASGLPDLFDGPVAKAAGTASVRGAFLDSVADRVADALLFGGVAFYLSEHDRGPVTLLPLAILALTGLISYERAKAELLGLAAKGGLMERAERFVVLGACLLAAAVDPAALVPGLWIFLGLVAATAVGRFVRVVRLAPAASAPEGSPAEPGAAEPGAEVSGAVAWRRGRVDSRWRAWRASRAVRRPTSRRTAATTPASRASGSGLAVPGGARRPVRPRHGASELSARWRARRAGVPGSRVGRLWRERRAGRLLGRTGRRSGAGGR